MSRRHRVIALAALTAAIDGLWACVLLRRHSDADANTLFFTAGLNEGLFGTITPSGSK